MLYASLFDAGLPSIMAGHISLPSYVRLFNPETTLEEANLLAILRNPNLTDLLRDEKGFNGLVVTDALQSPFHLADVPQVQTYINAHDSN